MKWCPAPYVIRELKIKTMRYHYLPTRMAKVKTLRTPNASVDVKQQDPTFIADGAAKCCSHYGRQSGSFL